MPVTLTIDQDRRLVYSAFLGTINETEFLGQTDRIQSHPLFDPHYADIVDFSSTTEVNVSEGAIRTMARQKSIFARDAIHIIIAPRGLISKLPNMFQEVTKPIRTNVVVLQTPVQAYEYLRQHSKYHSERKPSSSRVSEEAGTFRRRSAQLHTARHKRKNDCGDFVRTLPRLPHRCYCPDKSTGSHNRARCYCAC
jgi:hypothetical protein